MNIYDQPMTPEELTMNTEQYSDNTIRQIAEHLCTAVGLNTNDPTIGRFLCNTLVTDNVEATERWFKHYLGEHGALDGSMDLDRYEADFRAAFHKRVPGHLLGEDD